jgi:hypothetical protein
MAKQKGVVKLKGGIGDLSFYKTQDGYLAREKTEISGDRIRKDPAFARTRENNAEFASANKAGKLLRESLKPVTSGIADGRVTARLGRKMMEVVKSDAVSDRGKRHVPGGEIALLARFQFNVNTPLEHAISARPTAVFNRTTGAATVTFEPFVPKKMMGAPIEATHYTLVLGISACNFTAETYTNGVSRSSELEMLDTPVTLPPLVANIGAGVADPVFVALGIEFWQLVNGKFYSLQGPYNAAALVLVDAGN